MNKPQIDLHTKEYLHDRINSAMQILAEVVSEMERWETKNMSQEIKPCIAGHKHTDAATQYAEGYPWVCLSCGAEFKDYQSLVESE